MVKSIRGKRKGVNKKRESDQKRNRWVMQILKMENCATKRELDDTIPIVKVSI